MTDLPAKPLKPIDRLRALVDYVGKHDVDESTTAWVRYCAYVPKDATSLTTMESDALLLQLSEAGKGWKTRVDQLRDSIRKASRLRVIRRNDPEEHEDPRDPDVMQMLAKDRHNEPLKSLRNLATIYEHDHRWGPRLRLNEFTAEIEVDGAASTDIVTTGAALWVDETYAMEFPTPKAYEALRFVASRKPYHPVREYLRGVTWDREPRVHGFLSAYLGAEHTEMNQTLSACFLVSCVARIMKPGCQVDTVLVLQGEEGEGKSQAIKTLCGSAWFTDANLDVKDKDAFQLVQGVWIYELGEIDEWNGKREASANKRFISAQVDKYRPPYGHQPVKQPRQCVFVGSTNVVNFLPETTGTRRFWPVKTAVFGPVRLTDIAADRDQLWAEAVAMYDAGQQWHLTREDAASLAELSDEFRGHDPWQERIDDFIALPEWRLGFYMGDLLKFLEVPLERQTAAVAQRAGKLLHKMDCTVASKRDGKKRRNLWKPPS